MQRKEFLKSKDLGLKYPSRGLDRNYQKSRIDPNFVKPATGKYARGIQTNLCGSREFL